MFYFNLSFRIRKYSRSDNMKNVHQKYLYCLRLVTRTVTVNIYVIVNYHIVILHGRQQWWNVTKYFSQVLN